MICRDSKFQWFQVMLKPDLSTASLHVINAYQPTPHHSEYVTFQDYMICEDTLVSCWIYNDGRPHQYECGAYSGLTSARSTNIISHGGLATKILLPDNGHDEYVLFSCLAPGRFVRLDRGDSVADPDFF